MATWVAVSVLALAFAILAVSQLALYTHFARMYVSSGQGLDSHGPKVGTILAPTVVARLDGARRELPSPGQPTVVLFGSTDCRVCRALQPSLISVALANPGVKLNIVYGGGPEAVRAALEGMPATVDRIADPHLKLAASFGIGLSPMFVATDASGRIVKKGIASDPTSIAQLFDAASGRLASWPSNWKTNEEVPA